MSLNRGPQHELRVVDSELVAALTVPPLLSQPPYKNARIEDFLANRHACAVVPDHLNDAPAGFNRRSNLNLSQKHVVIPLAELYWGEAVIDHESRLRVAWVDC